MWSDRGPAGPAAERALGLELAELVATQPRHCRSPGGSGFRPGRGERTGRGWARSLDLDSVSPYQSGDDVRRIHWLATARTGDVQVRRFTAEAHRARMLVVDLHPALCFGTRDRLMAKTAALMAGRLAWEALDAQEPVGLLAGEAAAILEPRRGKRHVLHLLEHLQRRYEAVRAEADGEGASSPLTGSGLDAAVLADVSTRLRHRDEICVISDFPEIGADFVRQSAALAASRTLRAYVVDDPLFRRPLPAGRYPLRDPKRAGRVTAEVAQTHLANSPSLQALRRERRRQLEDCGWRVEDALDLLPRDGLP